MPMKRSEQIWFNGKFVPWDKAQVHVFAHALHYGSSVFEGMRCYKTLRGPAVLCLTEHIERLYNSCKIYRMKIPYSPDELQEATLETIRVNGLKECYIRPIVFRGFDSFNLNPRSCPVEVAIGVIEWGALLGAESIEKGVDVQVSSWRRMAPGTFPALAKIGGQYVNSQLVAMEANDHGYSEGIALDVQGYVSEGSGENIFVVKDKTIYTPPLTASILAGITRQIVITLAQDLGYAVKEYIVPREFLYIADEVFFTGTAAEVTPVRSIDRILIGEGKRGSMTERIQSEFFGIISGKIADRHRWLTSVE